MAHALVIGTDRRTADAAIDGLWNEGYHSIFHVDRIAEAYPLFVECRPAIVLALPDVMQGSSRRDLRRLSKEAGAPVVAARENVKRALSCLGPNVGEGKIPLAA